MAQHAIRSIQAGAVRHTVWRIAHVIKSHFLLCDSQSHATAQSDTSRVVQTKLIAFFSMLLAHLASPMPSLNYRLASLLRKVYNMSILRKGRPGYQVALQSTCSHATNKYKVLMRDRYSLYFITFSLVCQNSHPLIEHWHLPMPVFGSSVAMRRHCGHQISVPLQTCGRYIIVWEDLMIGKKMFSFHSLDKT